MSSFFRGAINLLQGDIGGVSSPSHHLVGQELDVAGTRIRIRSLLAEGGFAVVFTAEDQKGQYYALKRQIANDREAASAVENEIALLKELSANDAIIKIFKADKKRASNGGTEYYILTELCTGGSVVDFLKEHRPQPDDVIRIFMAACNAIKHMHRRPQPITHRDIKVENLLLDAHGKVKLCDFGSATREVHHPDDSWTVSMRTRLIEEMQRNTTPMYRAPEVQDEYMNMPVGPQQDVWALGCVLFYLCYRVHPFEDSAKLRIINAKYVIPQDDTLCTMFIPLIQSCLQPDPRLRVTISDLVERTGALAAAMEVDVTSPVNLMTVINTTVPSDGGPAASRIPLGRSDVSEVSQQASAMFGAIKGQGMSLFKNIKDKSAAVVQTVQCTYGGRGPDVCWVTSRILLAPQEPVLETLAAPAEDVLRTYCTEQHRPYLVTNVSNRRLRCEFPARPLEHLFPPLTIGPCPTLNSLLKICRSIVQFLMQNPNGFVVVYGSEAHSVLIAASLVLYNRLLPHPMNILEFIGKKRSVTLPPSFHRLLDLVRKVVYTPKENLRREVHNYSIQLETIVMEPLPRINRLRKGCRPFIDIYSAGNKLWSTYKEYDDLKTFEDPERLADLKLSSVPVGDDVTVVAFHARWSKMQNKLQQVWIFSAGFHANFWDRKESTITFSRGDLDINQSESEYIPENFRVVLGLKIGAQDRGFSNGVAEPPAFLGYDPTSVSPTHLVADSEEEGTIKRNYDFGTESTTTNSDPLTSRNQSAPTSDFFGTLDWGQSSITPPVAKITTIEKSLNLFDSNDTVTNKRNPSPSENLTRPETFTGVDTAESCERMYGIRVGKEDEDDDADKYKFDYEKSSARETPIFGTPTPVQSTVQPPVQEFDLLGFGSATTASSVSTTSVIDPFNDLLGYSAPTASSHTAKSSGADLLGEWGFPSSGAAATTSMHRNVSAPAFGQPTTATSFDPFADFLSAQTLSSSNPGSGANSGTSTPNPNPPRPNYSRGAFDSLNNPAVAKPKVTADAFGDLLSSQGFTSSAPKNNGRTMGDLRRADEIKDLTPEEIKIRDWTKGKEKNIRALLGSLSTVVWEGCTWQQPPMGEILDSTQVKKWYRKACLVVHPDKQTGTPQEELAKAIFTELNEAWTAFEQAGCPST